MEEGLLTSTETAKVYTSVCSYLRDGKALKDSFRLVAENSGKTFNAVRMAYYRGGGHPFKGHGNCLLTTKQDNLFLSMLVVFSRLNRGLTPARARAEVLETFGVSMSRETMKR